MKSFINIIVSLFLAMAFCIPALAEDTAPKPSILITNANIFDGKRDKLATGMSVLVEGNKISKIAKAIKAPDGTTVIDAKGKTLMPGLTDAHYHPMMAALPIADLLSSPDGWINLAAAKNAEALLLQGFTTVREASGNSLRSRVGA